MHGKDYMTFNSFFPHFFLSFLVQVSPIYLSSSFPTYLYKFYLLVNLAFFPVLCNTATFSVSSYLFFSFSFTELHEGKLSFFKKNNDF